MNVLNPSLARVFLNELFGARTLPREPEPTMAMEDPQQIQAFVDGSLGDGPLAAGYLYNSAHITQAIQGCKTVIDLGCGPGAQLAQIARINPDISFLGIDLSDGMLAKANQSALDQNLTNVKYTRDDITRLESIPDKLADGVISTLALHHLPTLESLRCCFHQISRVLKPGGCIYLIDFGRLKSLHSVMFFAYMNRSRQSHLLSLDYERSLRAAFLDEDFKACAAEELPKNIQIFTTFKIPFLVVITTKSRPLPPPVRLRLQEMRRDLPPRCQRDLDDFRLFLRLGGMKDDPFK
jgi:arsenite methyltransferase